MAKQVEQDPEEVKVIVRFGDRVQIIRAKDQTTAPSPVPREAKDGS